MKISLMEAAQVILARAFSDCRCVFGDDAETLHLITALKTLNQWERNLVNEYLHTLSFAAKEAEKGAFTLRGKP